MVCLFGEIQRQDFVKQIAVARECEFDVCRFDKELPKLGAAAKAAGVKAD